MMQFCFSVAHEMGDPPEWFEEALNTEQVQSEKIEAVAKVCSMWKLYSKCMSMMVGLGGGGGGGREVMRVCFFI